MMIEHIFYSFALAMIFGLVYYRFTGRDCWWIIAASALAPDLDMIANFALRKVGVVLIVQGHHIVHGDFHTLIALALYALIVAFFLNPFGVKFMDGLIFALVGFSAHFFEDFLVEDPAYDFLYPLTGRVFGWGLLPNVHNFYGIANVEVLAIGLVLAAASLAIRIIFKRRWHAKSLWP
ncbi:MAG TPA: metal-dependent hydrolase [Methanotrichaceae archaeon]|nr:metal-dependent hydrolase [Methanotrichaceae archaeon]